MFYTVKLNSSGIFNSEKRVPGFYKVINGEMIDLVVQFGKNDIDFLYVTNFNLISQEIKDLFDKKEEVKKEETIKEVSKINVSESFFLKAMLVAKSNSVYSIGIDDV